MEGGRVSAGKLLAFVDSLLKHKGVQRAQEILKVLLKHGYAAVRIFVTRYLTAVAGALQKQAFLLGGVLVSQSEQMGASFIIKAAKMVQITKTEGLKAARAFVLQLVSVRFANHSDITGVKRMLFSIELMFGFLRLQVELGGAQRLASPVQAAAEAAPSISKATCTPSKLEGTPKKQATARSAVRVLTETSEFSTAIKSYVDLDARAPSSAPKPASRYQQQETEGSTARPSPSLRAPLLDVTAAHGADPSSAATPVSKESLVKAVDAAARAIQEDKENDMFLSPSKAARLSGVV